ncbi:MAG TPA: hypothetical protein VGB67_08905 [Fibrella sp.]|jgi:hypothetical protein
MAKGTQLITLKNQTSNASLYTVTAERDTDVHPLTTEGKAAFELAVVAGAFTLTTESGTVIPAGTPPPDTAPTTVGVSWMTGLRYSYDANRLLYVEQAGENVTLRFETQSGDALAGSNPDKVPLDSATFYGFGPNAGQGSFDKQWRFGKNENGTGGIPPVPIKLTFKRNSTGLTTSYVFTPVVGANKVGIPLGGTTTTPGTPEQPSNALPPTWMSARFTWMGNALSVEGAPVAAPGIELKIARADGQPLTIKSGNNQPLQSNTYYGSGPLSGQGNFTQEWSFVPTGVNGSGVPSVPIVLTFKRPDGTTYVFTFTPVTATRQTLFNATSGSSTNPVEQPTSTTYPFFTRGVVLGNSFTSHTANTAIGWDKNNGMAAMSLAADHPHVIETALKTVNPAFRIMASGNGSGFEQQYWKSGEDLPVYSRTTTDIESFFGAGNKVDLLIFSISENVDNGTFNETKFRTMLDAAIACVPKTNNCTIILRNGVWLDHESADVVLKAYALEKGYKFADMADIKETRDSEFNPTSPYYNNNFEGGVRRHYNDAGHAAMATRYLNQLKVTTTPGIPIGTAPSTSGSASYRADTFNYQELGETSRSDNYPSFETDKIKVTLALLNQDRDSQQPGLGGGIFQIYNKVRPGHTLVYNALVWNGEDNGAPRVGNPNRIFTGQGISECSYADPIPYNVTGERGEPAHDPTLGYNPNEIGDDVSSSGRLVKYARLDNRFYVQTLPMLYGQRQAPANEVIMRKWGQVVDRALILNYETIFSRNTNVQVVTKKQEAPCLYVNGLRHFKTYFGDSPYTNGPITTISAPLSSYGNQLPGPNTPGNRNGQRSGGNYPSEPWAGVFGDDGYGIALVYKDNSCFHYGYFGDGGANLAQPNKGGSYAFLSVGMAEMLDHNIRWRHRTEVVVGTVEEIRAYVYANAYRPQTKPNFRFNAAGREGWSVNSGRWDSEAPASEHHTWDEHYTGNPRNGWKVYFGPSNNAEMVSPGGQYVASQVTKIYVRMAFTGETQNWALRWVRCGQKKDGALNTDPNQNNYYMEENTRFPNGSADNSNQVVYTSVNGDGQFRVYEFNVASKSGWQGIIATISLRPHATDNKFVYNTGESAIIDWVWDSPSGPTA